MALEKSIFESEMAALAAAEEVLTKPENRPNPIYKAFKELHKGYKKLFRQFQRLIKLSDKQQLELNTLKRSLEVENHQLVLELGQAFESFTRTLATTIDAKHRLTAGHSNRVTEYSLFLGTKLGLTKDDLEILKYASLLISSGSLYLSLK